MATTKAVRFHKYGGPEVLVYEDMPRPTPGEGEVLVKVRAASVNPFDWKLRAGLMQQRLKLDLPIVTGRDFAGTIEAVGAGVSGFKAGDDVLGTTALGKYGSFAEYTVAPVTTVYKKPANIDFNTAAALPVAAAAAWHSVYGEDGGNLKPGQIVLIQGAAGGVGLLTVQLAKRAGARVIATCSGRNVDLVKELGADQVIDYTTTKFEDVVKDVDAVIDCVLGDVQKRSWAVIKKGGVLVSLSGPPQGADAPSAEGKRGTMTMGQKGEAHVAEVAQLVADGKVKMIVGVALPLSEATEAHEISAAGHARGKIIVTMN